MPLRYRLRFKQKCEGQQPQEHAELEGKSEVCEGQQPEKDAELEGKFEVCGGQQPEKDAELQGKCEVREGQPPKQDTELEGESMVCEGHQSEKDAELEDKSTLKVRPKFAHLSVTRESDSCTTLALRQTDVAPQRERLRNLRQAASKCTSSVEEKRRSVAKDIAPHDSDFCSLTRAEMRKSTRKAPQANVQQKAAQRREREQQQMRPTASKVTSKTNHVSGQHSFSEPEKQLSCRPNVAAKREIKERLACAQKRSKKAEDTGTGWWQLLDEMCSQDNAEEKPALEEEPRATSPTASKTAIVLREADNFRATSLTTSETAIVLREGDNFRATSPNTSETAIVLPEADNLSKELSKELAIVPRNPTLDDAPPGHIAYSKVKFSDHSQGTLFQFNYKGLHFQVTVARACNSDDHAARIARLMYMKCEEGFDKHAVISFRNELLEQLANHWQRSGGALEDIKSRASSSNKSRKASGAVGSSWASQLGTRFSRARICVDPLDV